MRLNLYLPSGYLNMQEIIETNIPFIFITGARGVGKTYGTLKWQLPRDEKFIYMRRTQTQVDMLPDPELNPLLPLNNDHGWSYMMRKEGKKLKIHDTELNDEDNIVYKDPYKALIFALSTIANVRGIDNPHLKRMIYDEFIPEAHEKRLKNEGNALKSAFETINRNRELLGMDPMQLIAMANSNDIANPLYLAFKIITPIIEMRKKDHEYKYLKDRGILLIDIRHSPISERKAETALYKACGDDDYTRMALHNDFVGADMYSGVSRDLKQYNPIVEFGEIIFYKHKSKNIMYATTHKSGSPRWYGLTKTEVQRFKRSEDRIIDYYLDRRIDFEQYYLEILLLKYLEL